MDKINKYQQAIIDYLDYYKEEMYSRDTSGVETQVVADKEKHHYQLVRLGWSDGRHVYYCPLHFDIKDGKVWVQLNNTEEMVGDELISRGVAKSDIVLGFHHESMRGYTGFAEA